MKKLLVSSLVLALASTFGIAQQRGIDRTPGFRIERGFSNGQLNRPERFRLRNEQFRYKTAQQRARRDAVVTPGERRKLMIMKRHNNHLRFRLKHNRRHRVI